MFYGSDTFQFVYFWESEIITDTKDFADHIIVH